MKSIVTKDFMDNNACHKCKCKIAVKNVAKGTKYRTLSLFYLSLISSLMWGYHVIANLEFWSWFELWVDQYYYPQYYVFNTNIRIVPMLFIISWYVIFKYHDLWYKIWIKYGKP